MDLGLKDKVVVCMSSASGFGKGIATEFAHEGAKVVVCTSDCLLYTSPSPRDCS